MPSTSALTFRHLREMNLALASHVAATRASQWSHDDWLLALGASTGNALDIVKKLNNPAAEPRPADQLTEALGKRLGSAVIYIDMCLGLNQPELLLGARTTLDSFALFRGRLSRMRLADESASRKANRLFAIVGDQLYGPAGAGWANDALSCADRLAEHFGIDLGAAVVAKFNATSERFGFPERLAA